MFEGCPAFSPASFFDFSLPVGYFSSLPFPKKMHKQLLLPDVSNLLSESSFAEVAMSWSEDGLLFTITVNKKFEDCFYPNYLEGDAIELFIDTRDLKSGFMNRFCHHFLFLPKDVHGVQAQEITRFRGEDEHPLCDPKDLALEVQFEKNSYHALIKIPSDCLSGYDPLAWNKMAIAYRISRPQGGAQHFPVSSELYPIDQHPSLWCSSILENER
ncbi:MAG: hypothetical protein HKM07_02975 [Chlamydiae bacterium]|nr:hypothetical protein [Chlamydiota bacterium]